MSATFKRPIQSEVELVSQSQSEYSVSFSAAKPTDISMSSATEYEIETTVTNLKPRLQFRNKSKPQRECREDPCAPYFSSSDDDDCSQCSSCCAAEHPKVTVEPLGEHTFKVCVNCGTKQDEPIPAHGGHKFKSEESTVTDDEAVSPRIARTRKITRAQSVVTDGPEFTDVYQSDPESDRESHSLVSSFTLNSDHEPLDFSSVESALNDRPAKSSPNYKAVTRSKPVQSNLMQAKAVTIVRDELDDYPDETNVVGPTQIVVPREAFFSDAQVKQYVVEFKSVNGHKWIDNIGSEYSIHVNGYNGPVLKLRRGVTYRFEVKPTPGYTFMLTDSPIGRDVHNNKTPKPVRGGFDPVASGAVEFVVTEKTQKYFYYQCKNHQCIGGLVTVVD